MSEPHKPSKPQAVIFFIFTLLLAVGVFIWNFYLDKGTASFSGPVPFAIDVGSSDVICTQIPCTLEMKPGTYGGHFSKDGYFDTYQEVSVVRGETTEHIVAFTFKPTLQEQTDIKLPMRPIESAPLRPPYLRPTKEWTSGPLAALMKNVKYAAVSPTEDGAIILAVGKEIYLFRDNTVSQTPIPANGGATWAGTKVVYLAMSGGKQYVFSSDGKVAKSVVRFERPFKDFILHGDQRGEYVVVEETTTEGRGFYIIDLAKKTRRRIELSPTSSLTNWTQTKIIFQDDAAGNGAIVTLVDPGSLDKNIVKAIDGKNIIETQPGTFICLTKKHLDPDEPKVGISIEEAIKQAQKVSDTGSTEEKPLTKVFMSQYEIKNDRYHTLIEISLETGEKIERLTADTKQKNLLYFLKGGSVWVVVSGE